MRFRMQHLSGTKGNAIHARAAILGILMQLVKSFKLGRRRQLQSHLAALVVSQTESTASGQGLLQDPSKRGLQCAARDSIIAGVELHAMLEELSSKIAVMVKNLWMGIHRCIMLDKKATWDLAFEI